jgi:hypothetical protein
MKKNNKKSIVVSKLNVKEKPIFFTQRKITLGILTIFFVPLWICEQSRQISLEINGKYASAVIHDLSFSGGKASKSYKLYYNFFVDSIKYKGLGKWYPNSDTLSVGDTIAIIYDKTNPAYNNQTKRDFKYIYSKINSTKHDFNPDNPFESFNRKSFFNEDTNTVIFP